MQRISKVSKGFRFLLSVINIYNEYVWVVFSKDTITITRLHLLMLFKNF